MKRLFTLLLGVVFTLSLNAQHIWLGGTDSNWNQASNWSLGVVPTAGSNATILAISPGGNDPIISTPTTIDYLVQNFGTITINADVLNTLQFVNFDNATVINNSNFTNSGIFDFGNAGTFENNAVVNNTGVIANTGNGIFNNNADAILNNTGTINNFATINNLGNIINDGTLLNVISLINSGTITNNDLLDNNAGANIDNMAGTIINSPCARTFQKSENPIDGVFTNNGILYITVGSVTNAAGTILNDIFALPIPEAVCQNIDVFLNAAGTASITVDDIDGGSTASYCELSDRTISRTDFDCRDIGSVPVTLTIEDLFGTSASCIAMVNVIDPISPEITCPSDITITLGPGECEAVANFDLPTATDICGASVTQIDDTGLTSGSSFPRGTTTLIYEASDGTNLVTCSLNINVNDFPNPTSSIACNGLIQLSLDESCEAIITPDMVLEGNMYGCYDDFTVDVAGTGTNIVNDNYVGQTIMVMVTNSDGLSCWGQIEVEDKLAPSLTCREYTLNCFQDPTPSFVQEPFYPITNDNCIDDNYDLTYTDLVEDNGCAGTTITRTWVYNDASGNTATCDELIHIEQADLSLVVFPQNLDDIELDALNCEDANTDPSNTGVPTILGNDITNACHFNATYEDTRVEICEGSYKILREWKIIDWCSSETLFDEQIIKVLDKEGPSMTCPSDIVINTEEDNCIGRLILPVPTLSDNCSSPANISYTAKGPNGLITGNTIELPLGTHQIQYIATDDCGNLSEACIFNITVEDQVAPTTICDEHTVIGINGYGAGGLSWVNATTFDDGSYDNCSELVFKARRMETAHCDGVDRTDFADQVPFYCCDVDNTVMVELRVTDAAGNYNSCMVEVSVQDKLNPTIICPPDKQINCTADYTDLNVTGEAAGFDNCSATVSHEDVVVNINQCGIGFVIRKWTATDPRGRTASCNQRIDIVNETPFYITDTDATNQDPNDGVIWPAEYETNSCTGGLTPDDLPTQFARPRIFEDECDLIATTYEDTYFPITPPACLKILRKWIIIDWCQFDHETGEGRWEYTQLIKVINSEAPVFTSNCDDQYFCSYEANCGDTEVSLIANATDDCTDSEDLNYSYKIFADLDNDGVQETVLGPYNGNDASGEYPIGKHNVKFTVEDGCGNASHCQFDFTIEDCKKPVVYCINGLAVDLMPLTNEVSIWATDFDAGSYDNCAIEDYLVVTPSGGPGQDFPPAEAASSVNFTCDQVGTNSVDLWVKDKAGNWDYCSTYIIIQDNGENCGSGTTTTATISGEIENEYAETVQDVTMDVSGLSNVVPIITDNDGTYAFPNLPIGENYTLTPEKTLNPRNGISTFDVYLISKHILGVQVLDSPYKMIAADANRSGSISALDIVALRKLLLFISEEFPNNDSWRFVDKDFVFPQPQNPFATAFPETRSINSFSADEQADFIAVKIGDVNGSAIPNNLLGSQSRTIDGELLLAIDDQFIKAGTSHTVDFKAKDFNEMIGYQFTLGFDKNKIGLIEWEEGTLENLTPDNFGWSLLEEGYITTSWFDHQETTMKDGEKIFSLSFTAKQDVWLSEALSINSRYTQSEAYDKDNNLYDVDLVFHTSNGITQNSSFDLYQNNPNPFSTTTTIGFNLPTEGMAIFSIYDVTGKLLKTVEQNFAQGYNELTIDKKELGVTGVLYYQLDTNEHSATRKMILTE